MFFLILARDRVDALEQRLAIRQRHIDYWLAKGNTVKIAGAMLDGESPIGSSFLIEADDEDQARTLLADDPFTTEGVFGDDIRVQPIRPAIGSWKPA